VDRATGFAKGDHVIVERPITKAWVDFMGMGNLVDHGVVETWLAPGSVETFERSIAAISGNQITLDIPLADSIDAQYVKPATVAKFSYGGRVTQVGLENLRFESPVRAAGQQYAFLRMDAAADSWLRNVAVHNFTEGVWLGNAVKRVTLEQVAVTHDATTYSTISAPFDFWLDSTETLLDRCSSAGGLKIWYFATQHLALGPNAILNFSGSGTLSHATAHQKWAT